MDSIVIPLGLDPGSIERRSEPIACGVPMPKGLAPESGAWVLEDGNGRTVPTQASVSARWTDGTARWLLLRWQATLGAAETWRLRPRRAGEPAPDPRAILRACGDRDTFTVEGEGLELRFGTGTPFPFAIRSHGIPIGAAFEAALEDFAPSEWRISRAELEEAGPLYVRGRIEAELAGPERRALLVAIVRIEVHAEGPIVLVSVTVRNPRGARHAGGYWELGDPGSLRLRSLTLRLDPVGGGDGSLRGEVEPGEERSWPLPFELRQESSGGEAWNGRVHLDRTGRVPLRRRGYRWRAGEDQGAGLRAEPRLVFSAAETELEIGIPRFWQNFPKGIGCDGRSLTIELFPPAEPAHELQGGEQKTQRIALYAGKRPDAVLGWCREPLRPRLDPEWSAASGAVPDLVPVARANAPAHEALLQAAIEGPDSFFAKRERFDEYGWRHFGDLPADHEALHARTPPPIVSHYNNQYDAIAGFGRQFLRSGDVRWWELMDALAAHVADVDVYHTDDDRPAYAHGLFWHTAHYVDAGLSTHRTYPRAPGVPGGGPANEHAYASGLALHHHLSGDPLSRDTVLELAGWVLAMDDGSRTPLRWLARGPTGLASATVDPRWHGPGRGAGNAIAVLLDAFELDRDRAWLDAAEALVRRTVHPDTPPESWRLDDAERRWSYLVFFQTLGRYLDVKKELGERDGMSALARGSLLRVARWMFEHERPFLERADALEFPTETWAAQDLRKADVLALAAPHAPADEAAGFRRRASELYEDSLARLARFESRTTTRPLVILAGAGSSHLARRAAPLEPGDDGIPPPRPRPFVRQRTIALRRAAALATAALGAALLAALR